ncbi:MAG TPA: ABC transporter permease [Segeticoccus sp.]|uniref:ABC transporter permease n=1 Tax=Segeticoccus sp. TaxID=2706531 RepID=UPI002D7F0F54|nr:ABC transporter permease [Segeticoccus sp.]HET8599544.1 ABC transporter permease [Segeticoccus sp.]
MLTFIVRRLLNYAVMLFVAVSGTYFLASSFLSPRSNYLARRPVPPEHSIDLSLNEANINDKTPLVTRYVHWLGDVLHGNFGLTPDLAPINGELPHRILLSTELLALSTVLAVIIGVGLGVYTAIRQYKLSDRLSNGFTVLIMCIPAPVLYLFVVLGGIRFNEATGHRWLYVTGLGDSSVQGFFPSLVDYLQHIALPTIGLTLIGYTAYHLTQRTYLLDTLNEDYVRTARAKGVRHHVAIRRHALRTSLIPTAMGVAWSIAAMFTGAVFAENQFGINGIGKYFIDALGKNDINGVVAAAGFAGVCTCAGLLLADVVVALLDPRIRIS